MARELANKFRSSQGDSVQMFNAAIRTTKGFIALIDYLFSSKSFLAFVLLGNIQSDYLEQRFGWWRQLCGGNYNNAVIQFLQTEKLFVYVRLSQWDTT